MRTDSIATYEKLAALRGQDRTLQLQHLGAQLGYTDPAALVRQIQQIIEDTETPRWRGLGARGGSNTGATAPNP